MKYEMRKKFQVFSQGEQKSNQLAKCSFVSSFCPSASAVAGNIGYLDAKNAIGSSSINRRLISRISGQFCLTDCRPDSKASTMSTNKGDEISK